MKIKTITAVNKNKMWVNNIATSIPKKILANKNNAR
jgi:hypothetical protein